MTTSGVRLSVAAYAKSRRARRLPGGALSAVQRAIRSGRIEIGTDGKVDREQADAAWSRNTDINKRPPQKGGSNGHSLVEAKTAESIERARSLRIRNDEREGRLIDLRGATRWWSTQVVACRDALLALPSRLKLRLPHLNDEDLRIVDAEIRAALEAFADQHGGREGRSDPEREHGPRHAGDLPAPEAPGSDDVSPRVLAVHASASRR